jgi:hypothetical protein
MPEPPTTTLLEDAVDIPVWLDADSQASLAERSRRDREIGRSLAAGDDSTRVRAWWRRIEARGEALPGRHLQLARGWINLALALIGLVGGVGLALAAFRYDGSYPVNVVRLLALLVAPQIVLLALNLFLIPGRLPGLRIVQDALSALNPGALAGAIYRQLTHQPEANVFTWTAASTSATRRLGKWQMLYWSQIAAVAFNASVIATAAVLVAFTDLAFGWSTTLSVDSDTAAGIFRAIATPWAGLLPGSVPDAALVERSQFFRLEGDDNLPDSRTLTGWWSFSVLAVVTYGLVPRLVFLGVAGWRLRVATRRLLLSDPRVAALLDRMSAPDLETRAPRPADRAMAAAPAAGAVARAELAGKASAVVWNQCVTADRAGELILARLGFSVATVLEAGGGSLDTERKALEQFAATRDPVVVLTPAWEPPLLEFVDFLGALRGVIGEAPSIVVVPVAENGGAIDAIERDNWSRAVGRSGDPRAYVEPGDA